MAAPDAPSAYAGLDADDAVERFQGIEARSGFACLGILAATVVAMLLAGDLAVPARVGIVVAVAAVLTLVEVRCHEVAYEGLRQIVITDCDPQKMVRVARELRGREPLFPSQDTLKVEEALCEILAGRRDNAFVSLSNIEKSSKGIFPAQRAGILVARAMAFINSSLDISDLEDVRDQAEAFAASAHGDAQATARLVIHACDAELALTSGDLDRARACIEKIDEGPQTNKRRVEQAFRRARLAAAEGDDEKSREELEYVAANGGTLSIRYLAEAWLSPDEPVDPVEVDDTGALDFLV